ncbi:MAG: SDR family NAD(P)-dependent oxidoreductase [Cohaesibacteraceae bacterium]
MRRRTIVIIGGTSGIGRALAERLVSENAVLIVGRSEDKGRAFAEASPANAHFLQEDVSLLRQVPGVVRHARDLLGQIDFVVHTADSIRTKRLDTSEGLEVSIAANFYSRVLFNQLFLSEPEKQRPERIIHIALAGAHTPAKDFIKNIPVPNDVSSFKGHTIGQVANDFYGLLMREKLDGQTTKLNVLNAGAVATDIRRNAQFPGPLKLLINAVEGLIRGRIRTPDNYAEMVMKILNGENNDANTHALMNSKGKGITGHKRANDPEVQRLLYSRTTRTIDSVLGDQAIGDWL